MIKRLFTVVAAMTVAVGSMAQLTASDITKIKKSKEYIYAESTEATEEDAANVAKAELDRQVKEYVVNSDVPEDAVAVIVKDIGQVASSISLKRGDMYRVFLYVKKKDITTSRSGVTVMKVEDVLPKMESKVEEIVDSAQTETEKTEPLQLATGQVETPQPESEALPADNPSSNNIANGFFAQITGSRAATLAKIAGASTIDQAEAILTEQKSLLNVKGFGSPASCRSSSQSYWVVATNNGVTILSPERDGKRWDYKTGNEDSLGKYNSRLWFRL